MRFVLRGFHLVYRTPLFRSYVQRPLLYAVAAFGIVFLAAIGLAVPIGRWLGSTFGMDQLGPWLAPFLVIVAFMLVAGPVFAGLFGAISALVFEKLTIEVEELEFGFAAGSPVPFSRGMADAAARLPFALVIGILSLAVGWTCGGIVGVALSGWLALYNFTAPALLRRRVGFGKQFVGAWRLPGAVPFWIAGGLASMVPILNVVAMPALTAAGALMCAEADRRRA